MIHHYSKYVTKCDEIFTTMSSSSSRIL